MFENGCKQHVEKDLETQVETLQKCVSLCKLMRFKLLVECLQLRSELRDLEISNHNDCANKKEETKANLDNVGTQVRLDLSVPSSSFYNNEELEEEEEDDE